LETDNKDNYYEHQLMN